MTQETTSRKKPPGRFEKRAQALRDNLKKRKDQAKDQAGAHPKKED